VPDITPMISSTYTCVLHQYAHHRDRHSFPTRRSSDLRLRNQRAGGEEVGEQPLARHGLEDPVAPGEQDERDVGVHVPTLKHLRRSEEHTSELQSRRDLVCRLLLEKKKNVKRMTVYAN